MQGADEKYRCSVGFQVRPVMIASREPADYALLVGVDYQADAVIGEAGIQLPVLPSLGPSLTSLTPPSAEVGDSLTLTGADLHLSDLVIQFGPVELPITTQRTISAGNHPVTVAQALPSGRRRHSNMLVGGLKPRLDTAVPGALALTAEGWITGTIELTGSLLGTDQDDVFVALYRDGAVVRTFDVFVRPVAPPPQIQMQLQITAGAQVPPGAYRVILRVNGQQARTSPEILLVGP
jgi:hypothetical protein